jgi:glycosyltransferase involved in cell wall biosynthesis
MPKLIRVTTVPMALKVLLAGQLKYMKEQGFDVIMVSADGKEREEVVKNEEVPHYIIPMTRKITPFADILSLWRLYKFFKKEKPDIVHSHTPKAGLLSMLAAKLAGVKIRIHTIAGLRFMTSRGFTRRLLIRMEKLTAKWATHVWPNSFSLLKYVKENELVPEKKLAVIGKGSSNGINLSRFSQTFLQAEKLTAIKESIGYEESLTYFLSVGRIVKDKGIAELAYSFSKLYEQNNSLRLIVVGTFEDELDPIGEEIKKALQDHPGVILPGWSDDVEYFMSFSFALLHPSYREGFPNVLLQAGALLCPVICSRIEGNIDIVEHERTGLIFEPKDKADMLAKMEIALSIPGKLGEYAGNLRQDIENHFDQRVVQGLLYDEYRKILYGN